jgi:NAD(P)-dependent dehydrogenase (short-subunit alcohol dehydrogenase family)
VDVLLVDLAKFDSVVSFAQEASAQLPRLDILIVNAGMINPTFELTQDGWESKSVSYPWLFTYPVI